VQAECAAVRGYVAASSDIDVLAGDFNSACVVWQDWAHAVLGKTTLARTALDQVGARRGTGIRAGGIVRYHEHLDARATAVATQAVSDHLPVYAVLQPKPAGRNPYSASPARCGKDVLALAPGWHVATVPQDRFAVCCLRRRRRGEGGTLMRRRHTRCHVSKCHREGTVATEHVRANCPRTSGTFATRDRGRFVQAVGSKQ